MIFPTRTRRKSPGTRTRRCDPSLPNATTSNLLPRVRAIIAEEIKHATNVLKPMIERLAHDVELVVAAPILEYSPLLTDSDLLEISRAGIVDGALSAVSRRAAVSDKVAGAIVAANDIPIVATLLANPNAQIREDTLDEIIEVAEQAEPLHEPLVSRPELSQGAIRRIAGFVSAAILEILNHQHRMDDETKQYVKEAVKKRIQLEQAGPAQGSLKEKIERMADSDELTEDAITGAGEKGQRGFVAEALAFRAKIDAGTVNAMLDSRSGKAVTALSWRAKLTARGAMSLQRHVSRVPTNAHDPRPPWRGIRPEGSGNGVVHPLFRTRGGGYRRRKRSRRIGGRAACLSAVTWRAACLSAVTCPAACLRQYALLGVHPPGFHHRPDPQLGEDFQQQHMGQPAI